MTTQPATLTNDILHLLEKKENREKFNNSPENTIIKLIFDLGTVGEDITYEEQFLFEIWNHRAERFTISQLEDVFIREIIRICLNCLDEFRKIIQTPLNVAEFFHDTYENQASSFGYETKKDTKKFDKNSPNGQLMQAVCTEIMQKYFIHKTLADKYGSLLYNHSIEELDEMFLEEGITI